VGKKRSKLDTNLLSILMARSTLPILMLSKQLEIFKINPAAKEYYGLTDDSILGEKYDSLCKISGDSSVIPSIADLLARKQFFKKRIKGEIKTSSWEAFLLEDSLGHFSSILLIGDQCADQVELLNGFSSRIKVYFQSIVSQIPEYVFWKNLDFVYLGCNDQMAKAAGLERKKDIIGKTDADFGWSDERVSKLRKIDTEVITNGIEITFEESIIIPHTHEERVMLTHKRPLRDENNTIIGLLGISTEITDRKKMEKDLEKAKEKSEEFNKLKSQFISNMEHDLRTPLSTLESTIANLLRTKEEGIEKQTLAFSLSSIEELKIIINTILDFENQKYGYQVLDEPFKLSHIFASIDRLYQPTAKSKGLELSYDIDSKIPRVLISDEWRIKHILINLVGNSLKFFQSPDS
jgi:PAS domain S-box-containing protein